MSKQLYKALGPDIGKAFQDGTHHNNYGAYELAKCVIQGLRDASLPIAAYIADDFIRFDPAHPDSPDNFALPPSPTRSTLAPRGN